MPFIRDRHAGPQRRHAARMTSVSLALTIGSPSVSSVARSSMKS